jgi:hypothetical protein
MSTKVEIINKALTLIGASPIVNITDDTQNARIMNRVYDSSRKSVLSECLWNFASKRSLLALSADTLPWYDTGVGILYARPSDVIRIFATNDKNAIWKEEGDYIVSDTNGLGILYVYDLDVPSKYTSSFIDAFVDRLASDAAYPIVNSRNLGEAFRKLYETISLPKAKSENSQTGSQVTMQDDAWEMAKFSNGSINS